MQMRCPSFTVCTLALGLTLVSGCAALLPKSSSDISAFKSFEEARNAIEGIVPQHSTLATLAAMGIDPAKHPNTTLMTQADVVQRLVPGSVLTKQDLDPGVVACIEARNACFGLNVVASHIARNRKGNFWSDFLNFSRRTDTTGWRFNAVILLVNDVVVYRTWAGQPVVNETEVQTNPLGPLQDIGPPTVTHAASR